MGAIQCVTSDGNENDVECIRRAGPICAIGASEGDDQGYQPRRDRGVHRPSGADGSAAGDDGNTLEQSRGSGDSPRSVGPRDIYSGFGA